MIGGGGVFIGADSRVIGGEVYRPLIDRDTGEIYGWLKANSADAIADRINGARR